MTTYQWVYSIVRKCSYLLIVHKTRKPRDTVACARRVTHSPRPWAKTQSTTPTFGCISVLEFFLGKCPFGLIGLTVIYWRAFLVRCRLVWYCFFIMRPPCGASDLFLEHVKGREHHYNGHPRPFSAQCLSLEDPSWVPLTHSPLPRTKWPPFRWRYFQMHFREWKVLYFD